MVLFHPQIRNAGVPRFIHTSTYSSGALGRTPSKRIKVRSYYAMTGLSHGISPETKLAVLPLQWFKQYVSHALEQ